jgi:hypothetical protein
MYEEELLRLLSQRIGLHDISAKSPARGVDVAHHRPRSIAAGKLFIFIPPCPSPEFVT